MPSRFLDAPGCALMMNRQKSRVHYVAESRLHHPEAEVSVLGFHLINLVEPAEPPIILRARDQKGSGHTRHPARGSSSRVACNRHEFVKMLRDPTVGSSWTDSYAGVLNSFVFINSISSSPTNTCRPLHIIKYL